MRRVAAAIVFALAAASALSGCREAKTEEAAAPAAAELRVASYEPTVEMYKSLNAAFAKSWRDKTGQIVSVQTSNGPSGSQSKKIAEGNEVDVAALGVDYDIDKIAEAGRLSSQWRSQFPTHVIYTSAVAILVRQGNPKNIRAWEDLARPEVKTVAGDPKTSGGGRWAYLSAWVHARKAPGGDDDKARTLVSQIFSRAVLDPGARQATTRFLQTGEGDALLGWEGDLLQVVNDAKAKGQFEIVMPGDSLLIELPVAVVDEVVAKRGTQKLARGYVEFLFSPQGQEIIAQHYQRPANTQVADRFSQQFKSIQFHQFGEAFGGWPAVMKQHFSAGGELDKMRAAKSARLNQTSGDAYERTAL